MNTDMKVLVIGGGFAGARVTQDLAKAGFKHITLVDKKDYFEVTYATLRSVAEPHIGTHSREKYTDFIKGEFVSGVVEELSENSASLADGKILEFDVAVLATGSSYSSFSIGKSENALTLNERENEIADAHTQLQSAAKVLVIGGGIVGVELAGELANHYPDKTITLAHSAERLVEELKPKASKLAEELLQAQGVSIQYNTTVSEGDEVYKQADLVYKCVGLTPNTGLMKTHFAEQIDADGRIKVDKQFRVEGSKNLFALGDCANVPEGKLGYLADEQAAALAKNIIAMANGKSAKDYKAHPMMALVPVGREKGFVQLPFAVVTWKFILNMKQKDLFISKVYKALGVDK